MNSLNFEVQARSTKSSELSPCPRKSARGAGSSRVSSWASASAVKRSSTCRTSVPYTTPTDTSTRRCESESVQLVTRSEISCEFGTINSAPVQVRTVLERIPIRFTSPSSAVSRSWMLSPTWAGRSKSRISPETKLFTTFCRPKPIPTPKAPASSVKRSRLSPVAAIAMKKPTARIV